MTMTTLPSPKDKFRLTGGNKYPTAEFTNKAEFNNMQLYLKRRQATYEVSYKKRSRFRSEVFTITLVSPLEALD